jgi:two-component system, NtrC family, sensor kinase
VRFIQTLYLLLFSIVLLNLSAKAQDQALADSLLHVVNTQPALSDSLTFSHYYTIASASSNPAIKVEYSRKAIQLATEKNLKVSYGAAMLYLGEGLMQQGKLIEAIQEYFNAAKLYQQSGSLLGVATAYDYIARAYQQQNHHRLSVEYYKKSIAIFRAEKDTARHATSLLNLGYQYLKAQEYDSALAITTEANRLFSLIGYEVGTAYALGNAGLIHANLQNDLQAEENLNEAIHLLRRYGDEYAIAEYLLELASIYHLREIPLKALSYAHSGYDLAKKNDFKEFIRDASLRLSELHAQQKNFSEAYTFQKEHLAYRDSITNEETIRKMADLRTEYELAQKQGEIELLQKERQRQQLLVISLFAILLLSVGLLVIFYYYSNFKSSSTRQLALQNEELIEQRNKLEDLIASRNRLFSIISHDLRGPVNAFNGISELIRHYISTKDMEQITEVSQYIDKSASQLSSLLDNLLSWSVLQQGEFPYRPEAVPLKKVTTGVVEMFTTMAHAKNIHLEASIDESILLWADANSVQTILRNLISNALKFTQQWGSVTLSAVTKGEYAEIIVQDTGIGIPAEQLRDLFGVRDEKRSWGTAGEKGLGIGLRLVYDFAQMNKGEVLVVSQIGEGTTFIVSIPQFIPEQVPPSPNLRKLVK